jgi:hypothetical protein
MVSPLCPLICVQYGCHSAHILTLLDNYIELRSSCEAASSSASEESFLILRRSKVHYRVLRSPPLDHNSSQMNPAHPVSLRSI